MGISVKQFHSIEQMANQLNTSRIKVADKKILNNTPFEEILKETQAVQEGSQLKFSRHANERLASRQITLSKEQLEKLENGAKMANDKGIQESLVMVDNLAFIVNIKNRTVITAVNDGDDKIFTNIDGAVIM